MNALFGLLAAPAAASVAEAAGRTAKLAATPFELLLNAAVGGVDASAAEIKPIDDADVPADLQDRLARELQQVLESLGAAAGDELTIRVENEGFIVNGSPDAARVEEALRNDPQLAEDVRHLAEINGLFDGSPFVLGEELRVEVGESGSVATLEWI
jgi:hypothetical protein